MKMSEFINVDDAIIVGEQLVDVLVRAAKKEGIPDALRDAVNTRYPGFVREALYMPQHERAAAIGKMRRHIRLLREQEKRG